MGYSENDNVNYGVNPYSADAVANKAEEVNQITQSKAFGKARMKVIGVGGAGNNAVNRLIEAGVKAVEYIAVNTDNQVLAVSKASQKIQIGVKLTMGLGAGADPEVGKNAALENKDVLQNVLKDTDLLFITAGMGGGTGTGAAPVIAQMAKEMKILTVAVVTMPFSFEGERRRQNGEKGVNELRKYVDSIIVIPNDKLQSVVKQDTPFLESFKLADEVLNQGIRGIAELIATTSVINLDFADLRTVLKGKGFAHMGIGVAKGEKRITDAVRCAVCSPLLDTTIEGAKSVILNVVGGPDLTFGEVVSAANLVKGVVDYSANVIFGMSSDPNMKEEVEVIIIATEFPNGGQAFSTVEDSNEAIRRAAMLSRKIETLAVQNGISSSASPARQTPEGEYNTAYTTPFGTPPVPPQTPDARYAPKPVYGAPEQTPQYSNQFGVPPYGANGGGASPMPPQTPSQPMQESAPAVGQNPYGGFANAQPTGGQYRPEGGSFEPDDPFPETTDASEREQRKHRPTFLDRFIRKNSDDK